MLRSLVKQIPTCKFFILKKFMTCYKYYKMSISFRVQYDQYFPSSSYFPDLFHEPSVKRNDSKIWETRKVLAIIYKDFKSSLNKTILKRWQQISISNQ